MVYSIESAAESRENNPSEIGTGAHPVSIIEEKPSLPLPTPANRPQHIETFESWPRYKCSIMSPFWCGLICILLLVLICAFAVVAGATGIFKGHTNDVFWPATPG